MNETTSPRAMDVLLGNWRTWLLAPAGAAVLVLLVFGAYAGLRGDTLVGIALLAAYGMFCVLLVGVFRNFWAGVLPGVPGALLISWEFFRWLWWAAGLFLAAILVFWVARSWSARLQGFDPKRVLAGVQGMRWRVPDRAVAMLVPPTAYVCDPGEIARQIGSLTRRAAGKKRVVPAPRPGGNTQKTAGGALMALTAKGLQTLTSTTSGAAVRFVTVCSEQGVQHLAEVPQGLARSLSILAEDGVMVRPVEIPRAVFWPPPAHLAAARIMLEPGREDLHQLSARRDPHKRIARATEYLRLSGVEQVWVCVDVADTLSEPEKAAYRTVVERLGEPDVAGVPVVAYDVLVGATAVEEDRAWELAQTIAESVVYEVEGHNHLRPVPARTRAVCRRFDKEMARADLDAGRAGTCLARSLAGLVSPPSGKTVSPLVERSDPPEPLDEVTVPGAASEVLPVYQVGAETVPLGIDSRDKLVAARYEDVFFALQTGSTGYGKTSSRKVGIIAAALAKTPRGVWFIDPHKRDTDDLLAYFTGEGVAERVRLVDPEGGASYNPFWLPGCTEKEAWQRAPSTVRLLENAFGVRDLRLTRSVLAELVRSLTLLGARIGQLDTPGTGMELEYPTLLDLREWLRPQSPLFLAGVPLLPPELGRYWEEDWPQVDTGALEPLTRRLRELECDPSQQQFFGRSRSSIQVGAWVGEAAIVLLPFGRGGQDTLKMLMVVSELCHQLLGRMRTNTTSLPAVDLTVDEALSLDPLAPELTTMSREVRKYGGRWWLLSQTAPSWIETEGVDTNLQAVLTSKVGPKEANRITAMFGGTLDPTDLVTLPKWTHWVQATTPSGETGGPWRLTGAQAHEVFAAFANPDGASELRARAASAAGSAPAHTVRTEVLGHPDRLLGTLKRLHDTSPGGDGELPVEW